MSDAQHMQHSQGTAADASRSQEHSAQLKTPSKHLRHSGSDGDQHSCTCAEQPIAPSPASVRPKHPNSPIAADCTADAASIDSHCSLCRDPCHADACSDTPHQERQKPQAPKQAAKALSHAAATKRRVRVKRQAKKAPLMMSKCYAAAIHPVLEQSEDLEGADGGSDR